MPFSLRDNAGSSITDTGTITNPISGTPTLNGGVSLITGYNLLTVSLGQGITLTTAGQYRSPFTITQTGTIQTAGATAVYSALASASLLNDGLLAANNYGVSLTAAGSVVNAGSITVASGWGIDLAAGGFASNAVNGVIAASGGILETDGSATVINAGTLGGSGGTGVAMESNGYVLNAGTSAVINKYNGVIFQNTVGTVVNDGKIAAGNVGVYLHDGGTVTNSGINALISSGRDGVRIAAAAGTVINQGTIINSSLYGGDGGVVLAKGGEFINAGTASRISGASGIFATGFATIINQGDMTGHQGGVYLGAGGTLINYGSLAGLGGAELIGGVLINQAGGNIYGVIEGAYLINSTLTNSGTVAGYRFAVEATGSFTLNAEASGVFTASVVDKSGTGVLNLAGATAGTLNMGGSFSGFSQISFGSAAWTLKGTAAELANGQTIEGFAVGDALDLSGFTATSEVVTASSSGVVTLTGSNGTQVVDFGAADAQAILNLVSDGAGGVALSAIGRHVLATSLATGITLTADGVYLSPFTITQTGAVENASGTGVYSALNGAYLANAGQVTGSTYGALFHASGTIINQGAIAGLADDGVFINKGGAVQNEGTNSVIYGGQMGVADQTFDGKLYVSNQGSIIGAGFDGVLLGEGGAVTNTGLISGHVYGVEVVPNTSYAGSINNQGSIYGAQAGVYFFRFGAGSGNAVTNGGAIMAGAAGQAGVLANLAITVDNQGLISGPVGIDLKSGGSVANSGTIAGTQYAVMLGEGGAFFGAQGNVTNTGLIFGHVYGVEVVPTPSYAGSINNQGSIYGAQGAGVYFFRFGAGSGNAVTNGGTIMAGAAGQAGVLANLAITVDNQGLISGPVGIDLKSGGSVTNSGTIAGTQYAVILGGNTTNQLVIDPSAVFIGTVAAATDASNLLELGAGAGTVSGLGTSFMGFQTIAFDPGAVWTLAGDVAGFNGDTITGFTAKDTLDVSNLAVGVPVGLELNNGVLSETLGGVTLNLTFAGAAPDALYLLSPDGNGGADITRLISSDTLSVGLDQGITLTAAGQYRSPFTITQTGTIQTAGATAVYSALASASLLNDGLLAANNYGVSLTAAGSVVNAGSIAGLADRGVFINKGGAVQNEGTNSVIYGGQVGVADQSGNLYVSNHGSIIGAGFDGVLLGEGGAVYNTGLISGLVFGVEVFPNNGYTGSINNQGSIDGAQGAGVYFFSGGPEYGNVVSNSGTIMAGAEGPAGVGAANTAITVVNQGLISGPVGIDLKSGGSVTNSGTIAGTQYAVILGGNTTNQLVIDPSAVFIGTVAAATDASNLLELGAGAGTVSGLGTSFMGFQTIAFDPGAIWTLAGDVAGFNGDTITGFTAKDTLDVSDLAVGVPVGLELNNGVLSETLGGVTLNLTFAGAAPAALYQLIPDGNGGTDITQLTAANTLSVSLAEGITLTSAGQFRSPFTITQTGTIATAGGSGVTSALAGAYLLNSGLVSASGDGVSFTGVGTVVNSTSIFASGFSDGVFMLAGGSVLNQSAAAISGGFAGIGMYGTSGSVVNDGTVQGGPDGVTILENAYVQNSGTAALISGRDAGVSVVGGNGTVTNSGAVLATSSSGTGLFMLSGSLNNSGLISGGNFGTDIADGTGAVVNTGTITASSTAGIGLFVLGGSIQNSALIAGCKYGVESPFGTVTISNTGTIIATVNAGALLIGGVVLNQSTTSLIEGCANGVQFSGATGTITNNGTISGTEDGIRFGGNGTVTNAGTISGGAYALSFSGSAANRLVVDPNAVFIGAVEAGASASNTLELAAGNGKFGGIGSTVSGFSTVAFDPGAAWTLSGSAAGFNGDTINGFTAADSLDIAGLALATPALLTLGTGGTLALEQAGGGTLGLLFDDLSAGKGFTITSDGVGGDFIQETACYAAGTRILTADGRLVAVEDLREADTLETFDGQAKTVIWLGRRTMDLRQHPRPRTVQPIVIMAGALGCGLPWRDLVVSPDHGMYLAGNLIPAKALTNGFTIRQLNRPRVTYYHIELAEHAVIFAEGAAAESYLATGNRGAFENGGQALTLHPDFAQSLRETQGCAPFLENGPSVEAVRQRILNHAKIATTDDPALHIRYENGAAIIESSTAVPGELTADPRDQRRLGVKIGSICSGWKTIPLDHPSLTDGWHDLETDGRWTNGHAVIPQDLLGASGSIEITLAGSLTYPQARPRTDNQFIHPAIKSAPGVQKPRRYIPAA